MDEKPNRTYRRFFQFRLSTWLVLVGILACTLVQRPYLGIHRNPFTQEPLILGAPNPDAGGWIFSFQSDPGGSKPEYGVGLIIGPNPQLLWPALALVAFIDWKAFWLVRERRRERTAHPTLE